MTPTSVRDSIRHFLGGPATFAVKWVLPPAAGLLITALIGQITHFFGGPPTYTIYVVGNLHGDDDSSNMFTAFPLDNAIGQIDTKKVEFKIQDDKGDPQVARQIAAQIAQQDDALLVIGHGLSSTTKEALPYYLGTDQHGADPPIPVVLTTETNPDLLPSQVAEDSCPAVLRLSPTDDRQASLAATALESEASRFWVVADTDNPVYSQYLTTQFVSAVNGLDQQHRQQKLKPMQVVLWSTNLATPSIDALKALKIDGVFFAGDWSDALVLIRQIKAFSDAGAFPTKPKPKIILTDDAVVKALPQRAGDDAENVYITHPLTAKQFNESVGYKSYGDDARTLVIHLLEEANKDFGKKMNERAWLPQVLKKLLGVHRVRDARIVLNGVIQAKVSNHGNKTQCKYERATNGDEANRMFHLWQMKGGNFTDVPPGVEDLRAAR